MSGEKCIRCVYTEETITEDKRQSGCLTQRVVTLTHHGYIVHMCVCGDNCLVEIVYVTGRHTHTHERKRALADRALSVEKWPLR